MAYYLLTVLQQDDGVEVQRLVKDLIRNRVSGCGLALKKHILRADHLQVARAPTPRLATSSTTEPEHRKDELIENCFSRPSL